MTKTIVLLDDDPDEQGVLRNAFSILHVNVDLRQFLKVEELLDYLHVADPLPEIILIDVHLPPDNGLEVLRRLTQCDCLTTTLTVIYTNASDEQTIALAFEYGAGVYLKKAGSVEKLAEQLRTLLVWNNHTISELPIRGRTLRN